MSDLGGFITGFAEYMWEDITFCKGLVSLMQGLCYPDFMAIATSS